MTHDPSLVTPWGPIGYISYKRTYARRLKENDLNSVTEEFPDTVERIVNACRTQLKVGFTLEEENYLRNMMLQLKGIVAGRFLWQLGTKTVNKLGLLSLQNCAFTLVNDGIRPFTWAFDALMLGSGVGFNIQREFVYEIAKPKRVKIIRDDSNDADFIVPDSREGWVELLRRVLESHFVTGKSFSYSTVCIRGKGTIIKGFGGLASGPEELCSGLAEISKVINARAGKKVRPIDCLDIMNIIGMIVVAGNVRRSAQIAIGDMDDLQFLRAKRWDLGNIPNWRAMSNNSVVCNDFSKLPDEIWEGYNGNGEPYGLINLNLARTVGRMGETQYPDPTVDGFNPCVPGNTEILTKTGYQRIDTLLNSPVDVWNGFEWSEVQPKVTGHNQPMVKVNLSSGQSLRCTVAHNFVLSTNYFGGTKRVQACDLKSGDKLIKTTFPVTESGIEFMQAYTQGFYSGDGESNSSHIWLYGEKQKLAVGMDVVVLHSNKGRDFTDTRTTFEPLDKNFVPKSWNAKSRLEWFAGLCDSDGCVTKDGNIQISSIDKNFLLEIQKMLTTLGVSSKVAIMHLEGEKSLPDGKGDEKTYLCKTSYRLMLGASQVQLLKSIGLNTRRLILDHTPNRDATRFVEVVSVEDAGIEETVYCFTDKIRNLGCFEGIVTGQCAEQGLADKETCCLAEVFVPNIQSYAELIQTLKTLYRICKHSLRLPCHLLETEAIVHANMRMGIGVTGYLQATEEQRSWLSKAYEELRAYDAEYSAQHGWPTSIKLTTVKPSGTLSLLPGVTPGAHPGFARRYIRRIRMASNIPLVELCRSHGFPIEYQRNFDGTEDKNTVVVSFPCSLPDSTKLAAEMTAIDQLEVIKRLQTEWSDNAVSVTIYYRKEELSQIKEWLSANYNSSLKTVSFLLHNEHGFDQAPMEEIDEATFLQLSSKVTPINSISSITESSVSSDEECAGGACPIK